MIRSSLPCTLRDKLLLSFLAEKQEVRLPFVRK